MAIVLMAAAAYAITPGAASAKSPGAASTPAERAAVHKYLLDLYTYVHAVSEAAPALVGAYEDAASRIAAECPGVLVGAPQENQTELVPSILRDTARQRGEARRQSTQLSDLESELAAELDSAEQGPRRPAVTALLANLEALPQVGPVLSRILPGQISELEAEQKVESIDACADMKAWAASGYRVLSAASRAIALKREAELAEFLRELSTLSASAALPALETPADKALAGKTRQLELQAAKADRGPIEGARKRVEAALGLTVSENREKRFKSVARTSRSSTKLGAGRTAAGTSYTVWLERTKGGPADACKSSVEVRSTDGGEGETLELLASSGSKVCLTPHQKRLEGPNVNCSEGRLTIEAEVLPATRAVDLHMSNGTQVVSRPVFVPRRLGGPGAVYYQAVRGPSPIPVSLTERDAQGRTLRVVKLRRIVGCSMHPVKYVRGGKRTLVRGSTPQGPSFSIVGERYRLFGHIHAQLTLKAGGGPASSEASEEEDLHEGTGGFMEAPVRRPEPLDSEVSGACHPHEYSIFYGLLTQPRDTVLAKIAGKLVPVSRVRIPSSLHAGGLLVYLASVSQPEAVLVRSPGGKVLMNENLSRAAREARETCEGESEGTGPPPGGFGGTGEVSTIALGG